MSDRRSSTAPRGHRPGTRALLVLYVLNASLLLCHEIDSAFWKEWELFHLPGGATGFVALHLVLIPWVLWGAVAIARQRPAGRWLAILLGLGGLAGGAAHTAFLLSGDPRFTTLFSKSLIAAFVVTSALQLLLVRAFPTGPRSQEPPR